MNEDAIGEAHRIMTECYLNLATCVLNGGQRSADDYLRVIQYCDNVLSYEPTDEQVSKATFYKGLAYMKAESYSEAIEIFEGLSEGRME
jgi:tetratricopeptide (TPR) repeat protein